MKNTIVRKKIIAISGSTRLRSTNHSLIKAISELYVGQLDVAIFNGLSELPHFNPDDDTSQIGGKVANFKQQLKRSDGIIICTPEYAHGVPGTLKNAIDWTVSSCEFSHKPTLLITASTDGRYGHKALLETLKVIEAKNIDQLQLLIQFAKTKINSDNKIIDNKTLEDVKEIMNRFIETVNETASENGSEISIGR
ncbi:NADPH-dependent FMN reductase [Segetibacter koreensis]|uniref:NADPH-dependent FMN reductase n=1 Tax=Segetibacter koreensis TaxID=398037 RepID=UPI0003815318|nr:NADPH-dependent FMN reductase [Segetibacter koreensis]